MALPCPSFRCYVVLCWILLRGLISNFIPWFPFMRNHTDQISVTKTGGFTAGTLSTSLCSRGEMEYHLRLKGLDRCKEGIIFSENVPFKKRTENRPSFDI
jgi:hypothetical protein